MIQIPLEPGDEVVFATPFRDRIVIATRHGALYTVSIGEAWDDQSVRIIVHERP